MACRLLPIIIVLISFTVPAFAARVKEYTELERSQLPRLFHLDDYDRCLAMGGLYCTGTFRLHSQTTSATFNFIKEYSSDRRHFDRTLLHRGYCLSARCPSAEANTTLRFERCVERHALSGGLRASLLTHACSAPPGRSDRSPDAPERLFLLVAVMLLLLNAIGTLYDLMVDNAKNKYLLAWSVRCNWRRLLACDEDADPRLAALAPIQGLRVLLLVLVMMTHCAEIQHKLYLYNPDLLEQFLQHSATMLIRNGSALVMGFVVISNFLFAYSLLVINKTRKLGLAQLPICVLHRIVRVAPTHLAVVAFAATWWRRAGAGPQWAAVVGAESAVCRRKFLSHAFFLHNLIGPEEHCLLQTWFLGVDMQLYCAVAAPLTLWLLGAGRSGARRRAGPLLAALFLASCLLNTALAYRNHWKSLLYIMLPENVRTTFREEPSFYRYYVSPWGSLPACLLGLGLAHLHFHMQETGCKISEHGMLARVCRLAAPLQALGALGGLALGGAAGGGAPSRLGSAVYLGAERPAFAALAALYLLGVVNGVDDALRRMLSLRGLRVLGRLSLAALMLHWCVNITLVASRRTLTEVSVPNIASDLISTVWWTYLLALLLTLLVEAPFRRTFNALFL